MRADGAEVAELHDRAVVEVGVLGVGDARRPDLEHGVERAVGQPVNIASFSLTSVISTGLPSSFSMMFLATSTLSREADHGLTTG